jgi:hypothetical protein
MPYTFLTEIIITFITSILLKDNSFNECDLLKWAKFLSTIPVESNNDLITQIQMS